MGGFSNQSVFDGATVKFPVFSIFYGSRKMGRIDSCKEMMGLREYRFSSHLLALVSCWVRVSSFHEAIPDDRSPVRPPAFPLQ